MQTRHLIDLADLTLTEWEELTAMATDIRGHIGDYYGICRGRILATLFYEPSTRTQMSFQTAMLRLGGRIIGFDNPANSSVSKGESIKDTVRVVSGYSDIIALRHPRAGAATAASLYSRVPVINGGDGGHLHPTQTLTDLATLKIEKGRLTGLTIGICGDLLNGRTTHSLIKTMAVFPDNRFILISTPALRIPTYIRALLTEKDVAFDELDNLSEAMPLLDVLYMTRIQKERFGSPEQYEAQKGVYVLDKAKMALAKRDLTVMHPLPRVDEIAYEVDDDPRSKYFQQTEYGLYARMALITRMLDYPRRAGNSGRAGKFLPEVPVDSGGRCANPDCITAAEGYLPQMMRGGICGYCEHGAQ